MTESPHGRRFGKKARRQGGFVPASFHIHTTPLDQAEEVLATAAISSDIKPNSQISPPGDERIAMLYTVKGIRPEARVRRLYPSIIDPKGSPISIPETTPKDYKGGVQLAYLAGKHVPEMLDELLSLQAITDEWEKDEPAVITAILTDMSLLPTAAPLLTATYDALTQKIKDPKLPLIEKFMTVALADAIINQTKLPLEEKYPYTPQGSKRSTADLKAQQAYDRQIVGLLATYQEPDGASKKAYTQLTRAITEFISPISTAPDPKEDRNIVQERLKQIDLLAIFLSSPLGEITQQLGSPKMNDILKRAHFIQKASYVDNPHTVELLTAGALEELDISFRSLIWKKAWGKPDSHLDKLFRYFISPAHTDLQDKIWSDVRTNATMVKLTADQTIPLFSSLPEEYLVHHGIFQQGPKALDAFLRTIPFPNMKKTDKEKLLRKLTGFAVILEKTGTVTADVVAGIYERLKQLAEKQNSTSAISNVFDIREGKKTGLVYVSPHEGAIALHGQTPENVKLKPDDILLHVTKPEPAQKKASSEKVVTPLASPVENTIFLHIPKGEVIQDPQWGELTRPASNHITTVMEHLAEKFAQTAAGELDWLTRIEKYENQPETVFQQAMILPTLIYDQHPLAALAKVGIMAIQRQMTPGGTNYQIIIDNKKAGIETEENPRTVLQATLDAGVLTFPDPADAALLIAVDGFSSLNLALTEAAFLSQEKTQTDLKGKLATRFSEAETRVINWNDHARAQQRPRIKRDSTPTNKDTVVVVPLDPANNAALFVLVAEMK